MIKKRKKPVSLEPRSIKYLKEHNYLVADVRSYNYFGMRRNDLFGMFDLLAIKPNGIFVGVQVTSKPNVNARVNKIKANVEVMTKWLIRNEIVVHGWFKQNNRWQVLERMVGLDA